MVWNKTTGLVLIGTILLLASCRGHGPTQEATQELVGTPYISNIEGFYLLNEGNMGANKASLDYYDCHMACYTHDIFLSANPTQVQALGDVGNELQIYGGKLYAVINCSNLIEVMDCRTAKHIGTISCPNGRYLAFEGKYGYVSSFAGPVSKEHTQKGLVLKFDTATLAVVDTCVVGYQPEGMAIVDGKLYVANSGGYMAPDYENELSVIDLRTFKEEKRIAVAKNLHLVVADGQGKLWVSSRGDYISEPSRLYVVDPQTQAAEAIQKVSVSNLWLKGDSLYVIGMDYYYIGTGSAAQYTLLHTRTRAIEKERFITDGTDVTITQPYGIAVHPVSGDIYLTDALNYVTPGELRCYSPEGKLRWSVRTGDIPAHFAFRTR